MKSDTPRTDRWEYEQTCNFDVPWEDHCRTLERELGEAIKLIQSLAEDKCLFRNERDQLKADLKRVSESEKCWVANAKNFDAARVKAENERDHRKADNLELTRINLYLAIERDQARAVAEQAAKAFHNYPNVPSHQQCLDWLAAYEKQKAGK